MSEIYRYLSEIVTQLTRIADALEREKEPVNFSDLMSGLGLPGAGGRDPADETAKQSTEGETMSTYEIREAKDGSFYYVVKAANGEVLSTSETYSSRSAAERAVQDAQAGIDPAA